MVFIQLAISAALFVVGSLLRRPPPDAVPANFEDFGFPDVDPSKRIPIVWGKKRVQSLHTMEVQDFRTNAIKVRSGLFGGKTTVGFRYFATVAVGICRGPDVTLKEIYFDNKLLWSGTASPAAAGVAISINEPNFNGSDDGVSGTIRFYGGGTSQQINSVLASAHTAQGLPTPAYRHVSYLVFEGFYFGNNPTVGQIEVVVERNPNTLGLGASRLVNTTAAESPTEGAVDLSLMEIAHEILTNDDWGLGEPASDINSSSFTTAAATLAAEGNAASLIWNNGDSIEDLLKTVMQQADGFVFKRMSLGQWEVNLVRDGYDAGSPVNSGTILEFDEDNSTLIRYARGNWDETFNITQVNWNDRNLKGRPQPAGEQDLANFAIQGTRQVASYTFPGVHSGTLAATLAARQLRATSFPLATAEIIVNRQGYDLVPGDVVAFAWTQLGIDRIFMRITKIALGTPEQGEVRLSLIQDVFGTGTATFSRPQTSLAVPQVTDPVQVADALVEDQSAFLAAQDPDNPTDAEKPRILARAPQGNALTFRPFAKRSTATSFVEQDADFAYHGSGTLQSDLDPEDGDIVSIVVEAVDDTSVVLLSNTEAEQKELGAGMILIEGSGSPDSLENEILSYTSASISGSEVTLSGVARAVEDTVPTRCKAGDRVWFLVDVGTTVDVYGDTDTVNVRLENTATTGEADVSAAATYTIGMRRRLDRPFPPGDVRFASSNEVTSPADGRRYPGNKILPPGDLVVSWARRDKNNATLYFQGDPDASPVPANYRVNVDIYSFIQSTSTITFLRQKTSTGTSITYTKAEQAADGGPFGRFIFVVRSVLTNESPNLAALDEIRRIVRYNPFISPTPSPAPVAQNSPFPSPASPTPSPFSPVPSPISPVTSPLSPIPSPLSPVPSPRSPAPSPRSPIPSPVSPLPSPLPPAPIGSPVPSPISPLPSPRSPAPSPVSPLPSPFSPNQLDVTSPQSSAPEDFLATQDPLWLFNFNETSGNIVSVAGSPTASLVPSGSPGTYNVKGVNRQNGAFALNGTSRFLSGSLVSNSRQGTVIMIVRMQNTNAEFDNLLDIFQGFSLWRLSIGVARVGGRGTASPDVGSPLLGSPIQPNPGQSTSEFPLSAHAERREQFELYDHRLPSRREEHR
jgi:hypothetical protein